MITEEIKAKAKEFAINALQGQIDAIADAYLKGYEDALKTVPHEPIVENYDTFQDMMLDSGTMWTSGFHKKYPSQVGEFCYYKALEYGLPTQEQYEELFSQCRRMGARYVGRNANKIFLPQLSDEYYLWVKSDVINDEAYAYKIVNYQEPELVRIYVGTEQKFLRVKNKNDQ